MSDRSDSDVRLPRAAEALLARWPVADKDERAWDESAEAILVRVEMARAGSTDGALLAPPLPSELGEGSISARSAPRAARPAPPPSAPVSLAALARAALAEEQAASSPEPARVSPLPARLTPLPQMAQTPALVAEPPPVSAPPPVVAMPQEPMQLAPRAAPARAPRSKLVPVLAASIALLGVAAAAALVVRVHKTRDAAVASLPMPAVDHEPAERAPAAPPPAATTTDLEIETPESLAPTKPGAAPVAPRAVAKAAAPTATDHAGKAAAPEPAAEAAEPQPAQAQKDPEAEKMKPAAQPTDLPLQPSSGAVQAAVAQVIGSARACVAGHDEASRASIVFGSDGRVQSVAVSGPAAGTPAEACIRSALSTARVAPFAKPTFSVGTTIRP